MSDNDKCPKGNFCDSLQSTNWILDSESIFHMKVEVLDIIPGLLEDTDKHIEVADRNHVMKKKDKYE